MSNVTLSIGGRDYRVACADGEEAQIASLGAMIDAKVASIEGLAAQGEVRALLFASLLLADELQEARSALSEAPAPAPAEDDGELTEWLEGLAGALENLADKLESGESAP